MTDEISQKVQVAADTTLNILALSDNAERGAILGATISVAAVIFGKTPLEVLDDLREQMPDDDTWRRDLEPGTARKVRNATRWWKGMQIAYVGRGNQG